MRTVSDVEVEAKTMAYVGERSFERCRRAGVVAHVRPPGQGDQPPAGADAGLEVYTARRRYATVRVGQNASIVLDEQAACARDRIR